jgi:hypothetical protein
MLVRPLGGIVEQSPPPELVEQGNRLTSHFALVAR